MKACARRMPAELRQKGHGHSQNICHYSTLYLQHRLGLVAKVAHRPLLLRQADKISTIDPCFQRFPREQKSAELSADTRAPTRQPLFQRAWLWVGLRQNNQSGSERGFNNVLPLNPSKHYPVPIIIAILGNTSAAMQHLPPSAYLSACLSIIQCTI